MSKANETFHTELDRLGVPPPWRLHDEDVGVILAADSGDVLTVDVNSEKPDEIASLIALQIILAVNTCAGFEATLEPADA